MQYVVQDISVEMGDEVMGYCVPKLWLAARIRPGWPQARGTKRLPRDLSPEDLDI